MSTSVEIISCLFYFMTYFIWVHEKEKLFNITCEQQGVKDTDKLIRMQPMNPRAMNSSAETEEGDCEHNFSVDRAGDRHVSSAAKLGS